jgi:uncharacterized damage-inducible protein DinB
MSVTITLDQLIAYTDHERAKWRGWLAADPSRIAIPFQPGGRFPDIGHLLDHVFLVERRHLARLQGSTPPGSSGVAAGDWQALFDYADLVRADLRRYAADFSEEEARADMSITVATGTFAMKKRTLAAHILLHEVRHLAQIAYAARLAGHEPPGQHDLFYFPEFA